MDDRAASVLEDGFPNRAVADLYSTGPSWNEQNRTIEVEFTDGERVYLKIATDGDGSRIARERAVLAYVEANADVPVPRVLASDPEKGSPYLATAPVSGPNLIDRWADAGASERVVLARRVGTALARLHERRFADHGRIVGGKEDGLDLETGSWTDVLVDTIAETRALAPSDRFDGHFERVIEAVEANRDLLDEAPVALCHGDPARPNCFFEEGRIGFLDWEIAHVGDPARELYRARSQQLDSLRTAGPGKLASALYEGYRERASGLPTGFAERRPVYEVVRFLGVSGFFEKWVAIREESPADLAAWVDEEMDRRLARIR
jgi:aminoglycoside phosphotransferase (APT) family kinase protein